MILKKCIIYYFFNTNIGSISSFFKFESVIEFQICNQLIFIASSMNITENNWLHSYISVTVQNVLEKAADWN